ncbi:MAG: type II toxin-antitoxin system VapC family toxin [Rhodospirillaceae bacterium]|nr:type II toxin-antitoxin system VapC family toxin [Rhodospirillaceae bacterium]MBT3887024.1 type II toxin-antitoxin system VapC family toxin [Rhodospirillaceae bacterium]MBT4115744.1 type II toxin-antitoxin system VapC family toxin [Rhodospirillaceae bacterium]MBT4673361.1 type II toxin-antitoxin system VapC family toxin [Rhodospirillaceae bacterium]MBT4719614.1 type II toxin-antitoxin system VapC family toxin [Rhodospirillaceae bacterium]
MILADTHALLWLVTGHANLGPRAIELIGEALKEDVGHVSAMSFWEIAMLISKDRLEFRYTLQEWRRRSLERGFSEVPVSGDIGIAAVELADLHADPADRIIVATAVLNGMTLITADRRILDWPGQLLRHEARL